MLKRMKTEVTVLLFGLLFAVFGVIYLPPRTVTVLSLPKR